MDCDVSALAKVKVGSGIVAITTLIPIHESCPQVAMSFFIFIFFSLSISTQSFILQMAMPINAARLLYRDSPLGLELIVLLIFIPVLNQNIY